jgi:hypothetical protein
MRSLLPLLLALTLACEVPPENRLAVVTDALTTWEQRI